MKIRLVGSTGCFLTRRCAAKCNQWKHQGVPSDRNRCLITQEAKSLFDAGAHTESEIRKLTLDRKINGLKVGPFGVQHFSPSQKSGETLDHANLGMRSCSAACALCFEELSDRPKVRNHGVSIRILLNT